MMKPWTALILLRVGTGGANELSDSVRCGEFLDYLRICQLLKKDAAAWKGKGKGKVRPRTGLEGPKGE